MSALTAFGRQRNLAITCGAIPQIVSGVQSLDVVRIEGQESLETASFVYKVLLKTPAELGLYDPRILLTRFDLSSFLGKDATLHIALDGFGAFIFGETVTNMTAIGAGERQITGIIETAQFKQIAERSVFFEITIRDWFWLGTLNTNYKVFQNQTHIDTILEVLNTYNFPIQNLTSTHYPARDYCVQYGESDHRFVSRLCAENGIAISFKHTDGICYLVLSDTNGAFKAFDSEAYHELRYHANAERVDEEVFDALAPLDRLTTGAVTYRDYSYVAPDATNEVQASEGRQDQSGNQIPHADAEQYHFQSDAFSNLVQPRAGSTDANNPEQEGKLYTLAHLQSVQQHGQRVYASGNIRVVVPGCTFKLIEHPQDNTNIEYIVISSQLLIEEVAHETQRIDSNNAGQQWRVETSVVLQSSRIPFRPERNIPKPAIHSIEIAKVVGDEASGENGDPANSIWTDDLGRIKIQFPWDRIGESNQNSSCWVRVASNDAGNQMGCVHLPRIHSEVLISFIKGDPDLPVCTGSVYNSNNMPPWQLPNNQALSGYRSRELSPGNQSSGKSNHLILDDSQGQIQSQLKSDHQSSSLSLGYITRIENNKGRQEARGQGYELRTDGHGAIRAQAGLFISTDPRPNAVKHITDLKETGEHLTKAQEQHESMSEVAIEHGAHDKDVDQDEVNKVLKEQNTAIKGTGAADPQTGTFPELSAPHLVLSSPVGIETSTPQSTHLYSGEHIALTSGDHLSMSVGKSLLASAVETIRFFVYKAGMRFIAAAGDIDIKALKDSVNILGKLNITQTANKITITAKEEVMIIGGGSYTKWNAGTIESGTNGLWIEYAASHSTVGPKSVSAALPSKKIGKGNLELFHHYLDQAGKAIEYFKNAEYQVTDALGQKKKGKLDAKGHAMVAGLAIGPAKVKFGKDPRKPYDDANAYRKDYQWPEEENESAEADAQTGAGGLAGAVGGATNMLSGLVGQSGSLQNALGAVQTGIGLAQAYQQGGVAGLASAAVSTALPMLGSSSSTRGSNLPEPQITHIVDPNTTPIGRTNRA